MHTKCTIYLLCCVLLAAGIGAAFAQTVDSNTPVTQPDTPPPPEQLAPSPSDTSPTTPDTVVTPAPNQVTPPAPVEQSPAPTEPAEPSNCQLIPRLDIELALRQCLNRRDDEIARKPIAGPSEPDFMDFMNSCVKPRVRGAAQSLTCPAGCAVAVFR